MKFKKLLIIGSNSKSCEVGAMLLRASNFLDLDVRICNTNIERYAPSMSNLMGKLFYKINQSRPFEWIEFNQYISSTIVNFKPEFILVSGIFCISKEVFKICKKNGIPIINFLTDDPFAKRLKSNFYLNNIRSFDLIVSTKRRIINDLYISGAQKVEFMFYAFDPYLHRLPDKASKKVHDKFRCDISFTGTGHPERLPYLNFLAKDLTNYKLNLYGNDWENIKTFGWKKSGEVLDNEFRLSFEKAKISICLLRKSSRDDSTQRTFEIAPCGGCGIYEDSIEHREIFENYPEYGFFNSPKDLSEKCKWLLSNPSKIVNLKKMGIDIKIGRAHV